MRKYEELKTDVLLEKAMSNVEMRKHIPDLPKCHKLDKTYLTAVMKNLDNSMQVINRYDKGWLEEKYKDAQTKRLQKRQTKEGAMLQLKEEIKLLYENALVKSSMHL